jgi:hypothetical protein
LGVDVDISLPACAVRSAGIFADDAREIPLNHQAYQAMVDLREGSKRRFGDDLSPGSYVFYWDGTWPLDPTRPTNGWRSAWRSMTASDPVSRVRQIRDPGASCSNEKCGADVNKPVVRSRDFAFKICGITPSLNFPRDKRATRRS